MSDIHDPSACWFAGHETFTVRHAWLPKAVRHLREQPDLFQREDALVTLGVGKNMVRSIRHWALATGIIAEGEMAKGTRTRVIEPTSLGMLLFGGRGIDRYLEDPATLWLLHWHLASRREGPTAWWWAFNEYQENEFTKDRMLVALKQHVERSSFKRVADSSLNADVNALIRTYLSPRESRLSVLEDTLDCPLTELSLIQELDDEVLVFNRGEHPTLPSAVVAFAVLDYWDRTSVHKKTMTFDQLAYQPGAPGRVFKLTENVLADHLETMEKLTDKAITYDVTAGLRQVYRRKEVNSETLLRDHYSESRN
jgi:Protein of unknown function (DUF4007)